uniref:Uncharacterized protein n=1 Tax=Anguilla anguilla TaxID=7936 RepID=A0A0E9UYS3_ANGAN
MEQQLAVFLMTNFIFLNTVFTLTGRIFMIHIQEACPLIHNVPS